MAALAKLRQELECCICRDIFCDPVTIPCGHSFCRDCICKTWDMQMKESDTWEGEYTCPECRRLYKERPELKTSETLSNLLSHFRSLTLVETKTCTYCLDQSTPAVKFCVLCEASLCTDHLNVHNSSPEHVLFDHIPSLEDRKCSVHKKNLEYYCPTEDVCLCVTCCLSGTHNEHQVKSIEEAYQSKKMDLLTCAEILQLQTDQMETRCQSLKELRGRSRKRAATNSKLVTSIFRDARRKLKDLERKVLVDISRKKREVLVSVSHQIEQLETIKKELSRNMHRIGQLCNMTDPLSFLRESDKDNICNRKWAHKEDADIYDLDEGLISATIHSGLSDIINEAKRAFCGSNFIDLELNVHTANNYINVSGDLKTATWSPVDQSRPDTKERFDSFQVMCSKAFSSGRHYWEVETSESGYWGIGLCYPNIDRKGTDSYIGGRDNSWGMSRYSDWDPYYSIRHDGIEDTLSLVPSCLVIGLYLDYEAGQLSFYELGGPIRHLHTYKAAFSEPLHVILRLWNSWVKICK
ncbi:E3 ubiquitin-protein ligase TRIM11-like [Phyllobates terribilis]|uniref:E3 ubiquitin-protein ligase TRIM11-like n=1 Tax=Phyllobates terribilis TaxID=111132 RepID=UPI003CCA9E01